ncbi:hypothetical protein [Mycobacteroides abscessus]|uniref:hypothetical protein n=1 Tax=Mycobacteroides abscessus TaxID=36809 RepID=UPI00177E57B3|nr:hypothetical protein [Mycobacteroides abscessus]QOF29666.1 hypothetical protein E3G43_003226 [Mycobacteroides abscessus]
MNTATVCGGCGRAVMRPMGGEVCQKCRQGQMPTPSDGWAHALMIVVTLFIVGIVAIEAGWL